MGPGPPAHNPGNPEAEDLGAIHHINMKTIPNMPNIKKEFEVEITTAALEKRNRIRNLFQAE